MTTEPWLAPDALVHVQHMLASYRRWAGEDLIDVQGSALEQGRQLFEASIGVLSHGTEVDPLLNYANRATLNLWECTWDEFVLLPSRLSAEPGLREDRMRLLAEVTAKGFCRNLSGVRISRKGRRFFISDITVWNVLDEDGRCVGQAAAIYTWKSLDEDENPA